MSFGNIYKSQPAVEQNKLNKDIEIIFYDVQQSIKERDLDNLSLLFTLSFFNKYQKNLRNLFLSNDNVHVKNTKLKEITRFKTTNNGFSVNILFTAITHTKHDRKTVNWRIRHVAELLSPNGQIGKSSIHKQSFKQKWSFTYEAKTLKVKKIKGIYLKQEY